MQSFPVWETVNTNSWKMVALTNKTQLETFSRILCIQLQSTSMVLLAFFGAMLIKS